MRAWGTLPLALVLSATVGLGQPSTSPATQPTFILRGRIVSPDHKPVVGAKATLIEGIGPDFHVVETASTDADGQFRFAGKPQCSVLIEASGYGLGGARFTSIDDDDVPETELKPPTTLQVHFVGPDGKPAAGIHASFSFIRGRSMEGPYVFLPSDLQSRVQQVTDAGGNCSFAGLPQEASVRLAVLDEQFAGIPVSEDNALSDGPASETVIKLALAATISGKVTYGDTGMPAAGVRVQAQGVRSTLGGAAITNAEGHYLIKQLSAGDYNVALDQNADWGKRYVAVAHEQVAVHAAENITDTNFDLITGGTIVCKATVKGTDKPLAHVYIGVYGPAHPRSSAWVQSAQTDADGKVTINVPPGQQHVYYSGGMPLAGVFAPKPSSFEIAVNKDQSAAVNFEFPENTNPTVSGRVVDISGKPVPRAIVRAEQSNDEFGGGISVKSDADGQFTIPGIPDGARLGATKGDARTEQPVIVDANRNVTLTVRTFEPASALVHVLQDDGTAVAGVEVELSRQVPMGQGFVSYSVQRKKSAADGSVLFKSLMPDARYYVSVKSEAFGRGSASLKLSESKQTEATITVPKAESSIGGMVVDDAGAPIIDAEVVLTGRKSGRKTARTDVTGRFDFKNIVAGDTVSVFTTVKGQIGRPAQIAAGTTDAVLVYTPLPPRPAP